jgi:hypothetical protein
LARDSNDGLCVTPEIQSRPIVMSCSAPHATTGTRSGFSRHQISSLHDEEMKLAELKVLVDPNEGRSAFVHVVFDLDNYSPINLGADFHQEIRRHFVLRIQRRPTSGGGPTVTQDHPVDILALKENHIRVSLNVTSQEQITASLVFVPIPFHRGVTNGFTRAQSDDVRLEVWLSEFFITRGEPPASIFDAVRDGDAQGLQALLDASADLSALDRSGLTALALARLLGRDSIIKELADRGAPDNGGAILSGPISGLLNVMQNDVPTAAVVAAIMKQKLVLRARDDSGTGTPGTVTPKSSTMKFDVHAVMTTDGCDKSDVSFTSDASNRIDSMVRGVDCDFNNQAAGFAAWAGMSSLSAFDAYRLATLSPGEPGTLGATVYAADIISGAFGGMRYSGTWPFGILHERTASVSYNITGLATLPRCDDPSACTMFHAIWYADQFDGDGHQTNVEVVQGAHRVTLLPNTPADIDLSQGDASVQLSISRNYSHFGSHCCSNLQQHHMINIYVADKFEVNAQASLMRGTHVGYGQPIGAEYVPLTVARADAIVQDAFALSPLFQPANVPSPSSERRQWLLALAQYHDVKSHPFTARFSDIYLRLVLLEALDRDPKVEDRKLLELIQGTLSDAACTLYLPEVTREMSQIKSRALALRITEADRLAKMLASNPDTPLSESEKAQVSQFLELLKDNPVANSTEVIARVGPSLDRANVAAAILSYVDAAALILMSLEADASGLAAEIGQFEGIDPSDAVRNMLHDFTDIPVNRTATAH